LPSSKHDSSNRLTFLLAVLQALAKSAVLLIMTSLP
jgi:hypothetical protein